MTSSTVLEPSPDASCDVTRATDLACWIHDSTLQTLEFLATGGYGTCTKAVDVQRIAADAADLLRHRIEAGADARADGDVISGLRGVIADVSVRCDRSIELTCRVAGRTTPSDATDLLVLATREALNNAAKHAHASAVHVVYEVDGLDESVEVSDDGVGFDPEQVCSRGIRSSIHDRIRRCGGVSSIVSRPGCGTRVRMSVPVRR